MVETNVSSQSSTSWPARGSDQEPQACQDFMQYAKNYARERPESAALWCLGIGFILGWKLKPW